MTHYTCLVIGDDYEEQLEKYNVESLELIQGETLQEIAAKQGIAKSEKKLFDELKRLTLEPFGYGMTAIVTEDFDRGKLAELYRMGIEYFVTVGEDGQLRALKRLVSNGGKWDWYVVGGRWRQVLKAKEDAVGELGEWSDVDHPLYPLIKRVDGEYVPVPGFWDRIKVADLDIEGMEAQWKEEIHGVALTQYDDFHRILNGRPCELPTLWITRRAEELAGAAQVPAGDETHLPVTARGVDYQCARDEFWELPLPKELKTAGITHINASWFIPREDYIRLLRQRWWTPHAYIHQGEWCERGGIGWFGTVEEVYEWFEWHDKVIALLKSLPGDTWLTMVDCHI